MPRARAVTNQARPAVMRVRRVSGPVGLRLASGRRAMFSQTAQAGVLGGTIADVLDSVTFGVFEDSPILAPVLVHVRRPHDPPASSVVDICVTNAAATATASAPSRNVNGARPG